MPITAQIVTIQAYKSVGTGYIVASEEIKACLQKSPKDNRIKMMGEQTNQLVT